MHSHDFFPRTGDMFWSPADWAWTGGLMDALLPSLMFGVPILGYRGRFDAGEGLLPDREVRRAQLVPVPDRAQADDEGGARAAAAGFDFALRSIMSAASRSASPCSNGRRELGVTINEMFGQTEINYVVGNCQSAWPAKPGSIGRPVSRDSGGVIDDQGNECRAASWARCGHPPIKVSDPVFFLEYWKNPQATKDKFIGDWGCTGDQAKMDEDGYLWYQGRSDDVIKSAGYRIGPAEIESCLSSIRRC